MSRFTKLSLAALVAATLARAETKPLSFEHTSTEVIPGGLGLQLWWKIDGDMLHAAVSAPITTGWVGFGIADGLVASMAGSDIAMMWLDAEGKGTIKDYYAAGFSTPIEECADEQDWALTRTQRLDASTVFEFKRKLDTGNTAHDHAIVNNGVHTRMLFAYNPDSAFPANGAAPGYHGANRATFQTNLFKSKAQRDKETDLAARLVSQGIGFETVEMRASGGNGGAPYRIPSVKTTYHDSNCLATRTAGQAGSLGPHANTSKPYILGLQAIIDEGNERYVHHLTIKAWLNSLCDNSTFESQQNSLLWAAVASDATLFDGAFGPLDTTYTGLSAEFHYDNPDGRSDITDDSYIKVFYTYNPPAGTKALGGIMFGDTYIQTPTPVQNATDSMYEYSCSSQCLTANFGDTEEITVVGALPHTHALGKIMETSIYYSNGTLKQKSLQNFYAYDLQSYLTFPEPLKVSKTDTVKVKCWFANSKSSDVIFGAGSEDEMCIFIAVYYPLLTQALNPQFCGYLDHPLAASVGICGSFDSVKAEDGLVAKQRLANGFGGETCDDTKTSATTEATTTEAVATTAEAADESSTSTSSACGFTSIAAVTMATMLHLSVLF